MAWSRLEIGSPISAFLMGAAHPGNVGGCGPRSAYRSRPLLPTSTWLGPHFIPVGDQAASPFP